MSILQTTRLSKEFVLSDKFFQKPQIKKAVDSVSLVLHEQEIVGLVGESGSGKTTLAKMLIKLLEPTAGKIEFDESDITSLNRKNLQTYRKNVQIVFQNPFSSLDSRQTVRDIVLEAIRIHFPQFSKAEKLKKAVDILERVGIPEHRIDEYPHEFSGGERQRIAIARALAVEPKLLILDEPVSSLDVSIQSQIIALLKEVHREFEMTYLFISHDLHVVQMLCNRVYIMKDGKLIEEGITGHIFKNPKHPYTKTLLNSVFTIPEDWIASVE